MAYLRLKFTSPVACQQFAYVVVVAVVGVVGVVGGGRAAKHEQDMDTIRLMQKSIERAVDQSSCCQVNCC